MVDRRNYDRRDHRSVAGTSGTREARAQRPRRKFSTSDGSPTACHSNSVSLEAGALGEILDPRMELFSQPFMLGTFKTITPIASIEKDC